MASHALRKAILNHDLDEVSKLLQNQQMKRQINARDSFHEHSLHWAIGGNDINMVRLLLEHGASVDITNGTGNTPLMEAVRPLCNNIEIVHLLLKNGAQRGINKTNDFGDTAITFSVTTLLASNDTRMIELLLRYGADPNDVHPDGFTSLMAAVRAGNLRIAQILLENGATDSINIPYFEKGFSFSSQDQGKQINRITPLLQAVQRKNTKMIRLLLEHGADYRLQQLSSEQKPLLQNQIQKMKLQTIRKGSMRRLSLQQESKRQVLRHLNVMGQHQFGAFAQMLVPLKSSDGETEKQKRAFLKQIQQKKKSKNIRDVNRLVDCLIQVLGEDRVLSWIETLPNHDVMYHLYTLRYFHRDANREKIHQTILNHINKSSNRCGCERSQTTKL